MTKPSSIDSLLERQARFGQVCERLRNEARDPAHRSSQPLGGPWITISRQMGALGAQTGQRLAEELHWQALDKEILSAIALDARTRESLIERLDEQATGTIKDYLSQMVVPGDPGQAAYLEHMLRVVWSFARQGNAIILGRGANYFLDPRCGLRVRLVAPLDTRVGRVARREALPPAEAERVVRANDARQAAFIRQVFRRDLDDPTGFDLVLNTGALPVEATAHIVLAAMKRKLAAVERG